MNFDHLCINCMKEKPEGQDICPYCGFRESSHVVQSHVLPPFTVLNGKYLVGKVLGEGGFGITYIAIDMTLEKRVAIKEFFLAGSVYRDRTMMVTLANISDSQMKMYYIVKEKFETEAKTLAMLDSMPSIVKVYDFFMENATSYIVMEYLPGQTLKEYVKAHGGKIGVDELLAKMEPVMDSLKMLHDRQMLHRDISPDNIMVLDDGRMKLFDFGGVKIQSRREVSIVTLAKPGYSPLEQYQESGVLGPWTDIYSLAATMYYCLCGKVPVEALARMGAKDSLESLKSQGIQLPSSVEAAIAKGMAPREADRFQNVEEFKAALYKKGRNQKPAPEPGAKSVKWVIPVAVAAVLLAGGIAGYVFLAGGKKEPGGRSQVTNETGAGTEQGVQTAEPETENVQPGQTAEPVTENVQPGQTAEPGAENVQPGQTVEPVTEAVTAGQPAEPMTERQPAEPATEAATDGQTAEPVTDAATDGQPAEAVTEAVADGQAAEPVTEAVQETEPQSAAGPVVPSGEAEKAVADGTYEMIPYRDQGQSISTFGSYESGSELYMDYLDGHSNFAKFDVSTMAGTDGGRVLCNVASGLYVTSSGKGETAVLTQERAEDSQQRHVWYFEPAQEDGVYRIRSSQGTYLTLKDDGEAFYPVTAPADDSDGQKWVLAPTEPDRESLTSPISGQSYAPEGIFSFCAITTGGYLRAEDGVLSLSADGGEDENTIRFELSAVSGYDLQMKGVSDEAVLDTGTGGGYWRLVAAEEGWFFLENTAGEILSHKEAASDELTFRAMSDTAQNIRWWCYPAEDE